MRLGTLRNVAIIALAALAVAVLPGGGDVARLVLGLITLGFLAAIGSLGWRLYRENQLTLWSMTIQHRILLYGAVAVCFMALVAWSKLWQSGLGTIIWFVLVGGSVFAAYFAIRESRRYTI